MSDYDYRKPEDPFHRETAYHPNVLSGNSQPGAGSKAAVIVGQSS